MRARRDRAVEERQCPAVVERADLGHEAREEIARAITFARNAGQRDPPVATLLRLRYTDQPPAGPFGTVRGRQSGQRLGVTTPLIFPMCITSVRARVFKSD